MSSESAPIQPSAAGTSAQASKPPAVGTGVEHADASSAAEPERDRLLRALELERSRLAMVFASSPSILAIVSGPQHILEFANDAYLDLIGRPDAIGKPLLEAVTELRGQGFDKLLDTVMATGEPYVGREIPIRVSSSAGAPPEERFFDFVYLPLTELDGSRSGVIAHGNEITEQVRARREAERARDRADRLQALTAALAGARTVEDVASVIVAAAGEATGAATGMLVVRIPDTHEGMIVRQAGLHPDVIAAYGRFPLSRIGPSAQCLLTGEAQWAQAQEEIIARWSEIPDVWAKLGTQALATVPLYVAGETIGAMSFTWTEPRPFPPETKAFFLALGRQAAQALERARLVEGEHAAAAERERLLAASERARAQAEAERERLMRLQALTAALSMSSTPEEVAEAVVEHAAAVLGARGIVIARTSPDGRSLEIMRAGDMPDDARDAWRRFPVDSPVPLAEVARTGEAIFLESRAAWAARYPAMLPLLEAAGHVANAVAPLVVQGRVLGALGAAFATPQAFDEAERALALTVAQQCAQALERARLFEAERVARGDAETANRAKAEFLAVMSHELRTPLNAIGGYAELMEMGIRGPVTTQQAEDLRRIQASQRHLLGLVNEVLNYARIETGSVHYELTDVPLAAVVASVEPLVAPQLSAKQLAYAVNSCDPAPVARADREKVRQVLLNLLSNAIKFTDAGGRVDVSCDTDGDRVLIRVRDSGIGIARHELDRVFEPFIQVNASLTRTQEGTGLGLAISRDLARGMGGDLTAESQPGVGSTFTLSLPAA